MKILIVEDEIKTARALALLISSVSPGAQIAASIPSVETAVNYLSSNEQPDLIFMDVQLADALCFEIFKSIKVTSPVIFCTAYDEYALDAFKANGIDYILKPFSRESISSALSKVNQFKNFFQTRANALPDLEALISKISVNGKKSFLVFKNNKYLSLETNNIAFFYVHNDTSTIFTFTQEEYPVTLSLEEIHSLLDTTQFFRINRQYLINFKAIKEVEHYFARKLLVRMSVPTTENLIVGKEKSALFLKWLEDR